MKLVFLVALLLLAVPDDDQLAEAAAIQDILQVAIQGAIAGYPIVHKVQEFDEFDPNISQKRRKQFYELHGFRAEKFIERSGLGIDGLADERLEQQRSRDQGRLQGVNYQPENLPKFVLQD